MKIIRRRHMKQANSTLLAENQRQPCLSKSISLTMTCRNVCCPQISQNYSFFWLEHRTSWKRSAAPHLDPSNEALGETRFLLSYTLVEFMQIDVDEWHHDNVDNTPMIRMYGVTKHGQSVLCHIYGFLPYFYVPAPIGFLAKHLPDLQHHLEVCCSCGCTAFMLLFNIECSSTSSASKSDSQSRISHETVSRGLHGWRKIPVY